MSDSQSPQNVRQLLAALDISFHEDDASCFQLRGKELDSKLAELKLNPQPALKRLAEILETAKGQERMDRGKARREKFVALFERCKETVRSLAPEDREGILASLQGISPNRVEAVEAYFRKFEKSSDKDVQSLREDLEMLRTMREDSECNDSQPNQG
jgi:hypothetical protein